LEPLDQRRVGLLVAVEPEGKHCEARRAGDLGEQWCAGQVGSTGEELDAKPAPLCWVRRVLLDPHREERSDGGHAPMRSASASRSLTSPVPAAVITMDKAPYTKATV
jgi:hypothetical protein